MYFAEFAYIYDILAILDLGLMTENLTKLIGYYYHCVSCSQSMLIIMLVNIGGF